jgi:hypothetical protein
MRLLPGSRPARADGRARAEAGAPHHARRARVGGPGEADQLDEAEHVEGHAHALARELRGEPAAPGVGHQRVEHLHLLATADRHAAQPAAAEEAAVLWRAQRPGPEAVAIPVLREGAQHGAGLGLAAHAGERRHHARIGVQAAQIREIRVADAREQQARRAQPLEVRAHPVRRSSQRAISAEPHSKPSPKPV